MRKNITLSADSRIIQKARERAVKEHKSLNRVFQEWLYHYALKESQTVDYKKLMQSLAHIRVGKHFTRDDFNAR